MTDIFAYPPEANPNDIKARDPTITADAGVTGTLAATEGLDTAAFAGTVLIQGILAVTDAIDTAAFAGNIIVQGVLAATEAQDTAVFAGIVASGAAPIVARPGGTILLRKARHRRKHEPEIVVPIVEPETTNNLSIMQRIASQVREIVANALSGIHADLIEAEALDRIAAMNAFKQQRMAKSAAQIKSLIAAIATELDEDDDDAMFLLGLPIVPEHDEDAENNNDAKNLIPFPELEKDDAEVMVMLGL